MIALVMGIFVLAVCVALVLERMNQRSAASVPWWVLACLVVACAAFGVWVAFEVGR